MTSSNSHPHLLTARDLAKTYGATKVLHGVNLDTLGLTAGQTYPLDFFYAERHCCASNFVLSTSIEFTQCGEVIVK